MYWDFLHGWPSGLGGSASKQSISSMVPMCGIMKYEANWAVKRWHTLDIRWPPSEGDEDATWFQNKTPTSGQNAVKFVYFCPGGWWLPVGFQLQYSPHMQPKCLAFASVSGPSYQQRLDCCMMPFELSILQLGCCFIYQFTCLRTMSVAGTMAQVKWAAEL